ncbi:MAG: metabolite traffic protein EboE [Catenulispora sp.]
MRLTHPDGQEILLSYCTNVHAAQDVAGIVAQLDRFALPIRERLGWAELGLGLWLPASAAAGLADAPAALAGFAKELAVRGLAVVTVNGFPYGDFHAARVKKLVYRPDWADRRRLDYTLALARILAALLPDGVAEGGISTLPLGWRADWSAADRGTAAGHLARLDQELAALRDRTGRTVRVGLEPEPGCVLERSADLAAALPPRSGSGLVGLCLDTCHLAVGFETADRFVAAAAGLGAPIVKVQAASAVQVSRPARNSVRQALRDLAEPRYLHQVRCQGPDGLSGVDDLPEAAAALPADRPWRVHFHVPVHRRHLGVLETTQDVLVDSLATLFGGPHPVTRRLEVETYTWDVLPAAEAAGPREAGVVAGISSELAWTAGQLTALGLEGKTLT